MHYSFRVAEIATHLLCKKPVLVLGPMGSNAAVDAMEMVKPSTNGVLSYINIDMKYARRSYANYSWEDYLSRSSFNDKVKRVLENNPNRNIIYSDVEYATPELVMPMLEQMMFSGRRVALVGNFDLYSPYMPLLDRCHIVRM